MLYEVSHIPDGWDHEVVGRFTNEKKAYRFAHLLALVTGNTKFRDPRSVIRSIVFVAHYGQSMRASQNLRYIKTMVVENNDYNFAIYPLGDN